MMNAFALAESISTRPNVGSTLNVVPYEFHTDNLSECSAEMAHAIMSEAVEMDECYAITEEIMCEAAYTNPEVLDVLMEASFSQVIDGVKKFFDKIISFVMGIIDKIKAYFAKTTGNVDKWIEIMKPRIDATMGNQSDWKSVSVEMWSYDEKYINGTLPQGMKTLVNEWRSDVGAKKRIPLDGIMKDAGAIQKIVNKNDQNNPPAKMNDKAEKAIKTLNAQAEAAKNELKQLQGAFVGKVAKAVGAKASSSLDAVWSDVGLKAHAGTTQRKTVTIGGSVDSMLKSLTASKDTIKSISDTYDAHLKDLQAYRKSLDDAKLNIEGKDGTPPPVVNAARAALSAEQNIATKMTSLYESALNKAKDLNLAYAREMAKEYMTALTKFAGHKATK